ncbi:MAG: C1 family peptidase [Gammaproteobacteria bacterium]|nr:C1 family peptidase [Gammaproteobacteria bacterium]
MPKAKTPKKTTAAKEQFKRSVVPDLIDLRDRMYQPPVARRPVPEMLPRAPLEILDQGSTNACTGFSLASVVRFLLLAQQQPGQATRAAEAVSPFLLYSMARRYDEFPGSLKDEGSSLRGGMKGWFKHGVCRRELWKSLDMPKPVSNPQQDWWLDAANRPLGAYYRVDVRSVTDMHVALNEVGILYASAVCHDGWMVGLNVKPPKTGYWTIPHQAASPSDGGHAFAIVGYTPEGFIIQNSWGTVWGSGGYAILTYADWTAHAMDCWVAQLGVVTHQAVEIAQAPSLRVHAGKTVVAVDVLSRNREIAPFIIDMENNGELSQSGNFRTQQSDLVSLLDNHMQIARERWGLSATQPMDVAIYAHGGLTSEDAAAQTAARWIPAMYDAHIFPIFFMWETDLWSTLKNRFADQIHGLAKPTGGVWEQMQKFWNQRLERMLSPLGTKIWGEMKQNAEAISTNKKSGAHILYDLTSRPQLKQNNPMRLHLVGHSAGSIVHSHVVNALGSACWKFESLNFMAPAVRVEDFDRLVRPKLKDNTVKILRQFQLTDSAELQDTTCRLILGYGRSLLYLVSESFEGGQRVPILGMEKYFTQWSDAVSLKNIKTYAAPSNATSSTTHGGFDDDDKTMGSVIKMIKSG